MVNKMLILLLLLLSCQSGGSSDATLPSAVIEIRASEVVDVEEANIKPSIGIEQDKTVKKSDTIQYLPKKIVTIQPGTTDLTLLNVYFDQDGEVEDVVYQWETSLRGLIEGKCNPTQIYFLEEGNEYSLSSVKEDITDVWKGEGERDILQLDALVLPIYAALYPRKLLNDAIDLGDLNIVLSLVKKAHIVDGRQILVKLLQIANDTNRDNIIEIIDLLVQQGVAFDVCEFGNSPLVYCIVKAEYIDLFRNMIDKCKNSVFLSKAKNGMNIAHYAAFYGNEEAIRAIIEKDTNKDLNIEYKGSKPIDIAQTKNHQAVIDLMVDNEYN